MFPSGFDAGESSRADQQQLGWSPFPAADDAHNANLGIFRPSSGFRSVTGDIARPPEQPRPSFRPQGADARPRSTALGVHVGVRPRPMPPASGPGSYTRAMPVVNGGWERSEDGHSRRGSWDRSVERRAQADRRESPQIGPQRDRHAERMPASQRSSPRPAQQPDRSATAPLELGKRRSGSTSTSAPNRPRSTHSSNSSGHHPPDPILARMQSMIPAQEPPTEAPRDVVDSVYTFDYSSTSSPGKRERAYPPPPTHELAYGAPAASRIGAWRRLRAAAEEELPTRALEQMSLVEVPAKESGVRKARSTAALRAEPVAELPVEQATDRKKRRVRKQKS